MNEFERDRLRVQLDEKEAGLKQAVLQVGQSPPYCLSCRNYQREDEGHIVTWRRTSV